MADEDAAPAPRQLRPPISPDGIARARIALWARKKHRINRPMDLPKASCTCEAWTAIAPDEMGPIRQRDFLLDAWNDHLGVMRRIRFEAVRQEAAWRQNGERSDASD